MLHGRLLAGLAARAVEHSTDDDELRLTRLTLDMFRSPPMTALQVETQRVRDGRRVRVVDVSISTNGIELARARGLQLRTGPHPQDSPWRAPEWNAPPLVDLPNQETAPGGWEIQLLNPGGFWTSERKQLWARDHWQLVAGEEPSPVVRAALAADLPNPMANSSEQGLQFINADLTLFLARPPTSEWIGLEVADHLGNDGIGLGSCTMYDQRGPIGWSSVCALVNTATLGE
jgi:hypothetical protein